MKLRMCFVIISFLAATICTVLAQTPTSNPTPATTQVPRLIKFSGVAKDESGQPIIGVIGITFSIYKEQRVGTPMWMETQDVHVDAMGHYTALLGSASADGVPLELFSSGEAQWLGVQIQGQSEGPRVLLVSVPYALKAHEAETLSGRSVSDFILANDTKSQSSSAGNSQSTSNGVRPFTPPPPNGPTNFTGTTAGPIVGVTQSGSGTGLSATAITQAAVAGTITGASNTGVFGFASNTSVGSSAAGVTGQANTQLGPGVQGVTTSAKGIGVQGIVNSSSGGTAVQGFNHATSGFSTGVTGQTSSVATNSAGVNGFEAATTGQVFGVSGSTNSTTANAAGVSGFEGAASGAVSGVAGGTNSTTNGAAGVSGVAAGATGQTAGVIGNSLSSTGGASGVIGVAQATSGLTFGVLGLSASSSGVGVEGANSATTGTVNLAGPAPFLISALTGNIGKFTVDSSGNGFYAGNLNIKGKLTKGSGSFKIDHPLDPANKYLSHSFVESPDMMNVYNGNITTDRHGLAMVTLPDYFEALNQDFRYQLTVIGQFAQAIVKHEIESNRFTIKTNRPLVKVSWQVTGIRHDAYADAYRILVEEDKPAAEQGSYLHPELFGQPASKSVTAAAKLGIPPDYVVADALQK